MNTAPVRSAKARASPSASSTQRAVQDDLRAVTPRRLHLGQRRARGHDHGGRAAEPPGGERDALGVVARAGRDDAAGPFGVGEPGDPGSKPRVP